LKFKREKKDYKEKKSDSNPIKKEKKKKPRET